MPLSGQIVVLYVISNYKQQTLLWEKNSTSQTSFSFVIHLLI